MTRTLLLSLLAISLGACDKGSDSAGTAAGTSPVGGACASDADCLSGLSCSTGDPGGLCTKSCKSDADCGTGGVCNSESECYAGCTTNADCRNSEGYVCIKTEKEPFCDTK
jgi:Cys-rich repeat protein